MKIGDKLVNLRKYYDLTQGDLAKIAGVSIQAISTWEAGTKSPKLAYMVNICKHFGLDLNTFCDESEPFRTDDALQWSAEISEAIREGVAKAVAERDASLWLSPDEAEVIAKYRALSDQGKQYIRQTLDMIGNKE